MSTWYELIPVAGDFINKVGFPIAMWVVALFMFYKVMSKLYRKIEPVVQEGISNHFNLVTALQDNSKTTVGLIGELKDHTSQTLHTLGQLSETLMQQNNILMTHSVKLEELKGFKCPLTYENIEVEEKESIPIPTLAKVNTQKKA